MQLRQQTTRGAARCRTTKSAKSTRNTFHINKERKYRAPQHAPAFPAAGLMLDHVDGANDHASHTSAHLPYFSLSKHKSMTVFCHAGCSPKHHSTASAHQNSSNTKAKKQEQQQKKYNKNKKKGRGTRLHVLAAQLVVDLQAHVGGVLQLALRARAAAGVVRLPQRLQARRRS